MNPQVATLSDFMLLGIGALLAMTGIAGSSMARLDRRPEWHWLATFAFLRAASPWIQMMALAAPGAQAARELVGDFCDVVAGVALLEFSRLLAERLRGAPIGRWVHLVVLGSSVPVALSINLDPLRNAAAVTTMIGAVCAAALQWHNLGAMDQRERRLRLAACLTLGLFGLLALVSAYAQHFSAAKTDGEPWGKLNGAAAAGFSFALLGLYSFSQYRHLPRHARSPWMRRALTGSGIILGVVVLAAVFCPLLGLPRLPSLMVTLLLVLLSLVSYHAGERIRDEDTLFAHSEQRSRLLIDCSPNATLLFDNRGLCILVNRSARLVFGLTEAETLQRPFPELWPDSSRAVVEEAVATSLGGTPSRFDAEYHHRDGRKATVSVATNPAVDADGVVQGFVAVAADVTVRRRNERAMLQEKAAAESVAAAKSEFLAVMTHEIRTPLGGVISLLESLKKMPQPPGQRKQTELALDSADSLLEILDQILDAAKIEAAQFSLQPKPFNPAAELSRVTEGQRIRAEMAGLELHTHFSSSLPRGLIGDGLRLRQVLANLLSNAIKFTRAGHVAVRVGGEPHPGASYLLRIEVSDTGLGIPVELQTQLFGESPADLGASRTFGSTGLGLAIVRSIVGLMGGDIRVASQPNEGTTITVEAVLPLAEAVEAPAPSAVAALPAPPLAAAPTEESGPLRILCAEDNPTNRLVIQLLLEPMGHQVDFAEDGAQAVTKLSRERFDVVLMDNRMPVMDGFQATQLIRSRDSGVLDHDIPVIALTANASRSYREQCIASGMNDYLTKPVREASLRTALNRAMASRGRVPRPAVPASPAVPLPQVLAAPPPALPVAPIVIAPPVPPARTGPAPAPSSLSEADLLRILDEAEQAPPVDPTATLKPEARQRLSQQYLQETPRLLNSMRVAWATRDQATLGRAGHSLKSSSRYVQADRLSEMGRQIEALAEVGDFNGACPLIEASDQEFSHVCERLLVEVQS